MAEKCSGPGQALCSSLPSLCLSEVFSSLGTRPWRALSYDFGSCENSQSCSVPHGIMASTGLALVGFLHTTALGAPMPGTSRPFGFVMGPAALCLVLTWEPSLCSQHSCGSIPVSPLELWGLWAQRGAHTALSSSGALLTARLVYDRETGKPKGYGFCEYQDQETALSAMRNLNGREFSGRALRVDNAASEKNKEELKSESGFGVSCWAQPWQGCRVCLLCKAGRAGLL